MGRKNEPGLSYTVPSMSVMQVFHWSRPYDSRVGYKSWGVGDKNSQKRAGKYWVGCTSLTGRYTYRQDVVTTPTRCSVWMFIARPAVELLRQALNP